MNVPPPPPLSFAALFSCPQGKAFEKTEQTVRPDPGSFVSACDLAQDQTCPAKLQVSWWARCPRQLASCLYSVCNQHATTMQSENVITKHAPGSVPPNSRAALLCKLPRAECLDTLKFIQGVLELPWAVPRKTTMAMPSSHSVERVLKPIPVQHLFSPKFGLPKQ